MRDWDSTSYSAVLRREPESSVGLEKLTALLVAVLVSIAVGRDRGINSCVAALRREWI
jgi:hypothetical protein